MMRKLTILVDMDDVLNNLCQRWVEELNARHNTTVAYADINDWDICKAFQGIAEQDVFAPLFEDAFWETLSPLPKSVEILHQLIADGHTVKVVTASYFETVPAKMKWLFRKYPFLTWDDVIVAKDKQMIHGDVLIDDAPHNLEGGDYEKILFSQPHNKGYDATMNNMWRVSGWEEISGVISAIAKFWKELEKGRKMLSNS